MARSVRFLHATVNLIRTSFVGNEVARFSSVCTSWHCNAYFTLHPELCKRPAYYSTQYSLGPHLIKSSWLNKNANQLQFTRFYNQSSTPDPLGKPNQEPTKKPSIWKRFKQMYKDYWYVLVPVHVATSLVWFGSFYYIAVSGIDLVPFMERIGAPDFVMKTIKTSGAGYVAVAYALYKIATPARYAVTIGGTTVAINYLQRWGVIKPAPSPARLHQMIKDKRASFQAGLQRRKQLRIAKQKEQKKADGTKPK